MDPHRKELQDLWRTRLRDAGLHLDVACQHTKEMQQDAAASVLPPVDGNFALLKALREENLARQEYNLTLQFYKDLLLNGVIPDEDAWQKQ